MVQERCLITHQLVTELRARLDNKAVYDDLLEELEEVQELANNSHPARDVLTLRAFYLLEVMYHKLIPTAVVPRLDNPRGLQKVGAAARTTTLSAMADAGEMMADIQNWRFPRSREGLTELMRRLREMADETEVEDYALALDGRVDPSLRDLRHTQARPLHSLLGHTMNFARELRKALNYESQVAWPYFGSAFTSAWLTANQDESDLIAHAFRLVRIYTNTALSPWNPTKSSRD
jgi:hypothetical protein